MNLAFYIILLSIVFFSMYVIYKTINYREKLTPMVGMMIAMTLGMSVGLTVGVIVGILLPTNFFIATILGMFVGMIVGFSAGLPFHTIAVLDGLLSGLMGGMMGAMLGNMIDMGYDAAMTKIMFFIFLGTMMILLQMIHQTAKEKVNLQPYLLITIALFTFYFVIFEWAY
ncbi:hypothetical protein ACFFIS_15305 [Virgibacillus soli]